MAPAPPRLDEDSPVLIPFPLPSILVSKTGILWHAVVSGVRKAERPRACHDSLVAVEAVADIAANVDSSSHGDRFRVFYLREAGESEQVMRIENRVGSIATTKKHELGRLLRRHRSRVSSNVSWMPLEGGHPLS